MTQVIEHVEKYEHFFPLFCFVFFCLFGWLVGVLFGCLGFFFFFGGCVIVVLKLGVFFAISLTKSQPLMGSFFYCFSNWERVLSGIPYL